MKDEDKKYITHRQDSAVKPSPIFSATIGHEAVLTLLSSTIERSSL